MWHLVYVRPCDLWQSKMSSPLAKVSISMLLISFRSSFLYWIPTNHQALDRIFNSCKDGSRVVCLCVCGYVCSGVERKGSVSWVLIRIEVCHWLKLVGWYFHFHPVAVIEIIKRKGETKPLLAAVWTESWILPEPNSYKRILFSPEELEEIIWCNKPKTVIKNLIFLWIKLWQTKFFFSFFSFFNNNRQYEKQLWQIGLWF